MMQDAGESTAQRRCAAENILVGRASSEKTEIRSRVRRSWIVRVYDKVEN